MALVREGGPHVADDAQDAIAFADWVAPHLAVLSALAVHEVGTADAEDVVQETLLRAWRRQETFRAERGTPRAWLIALLLDRARRHRVRARPLTTFGLSREANASDREPEEPASDRMDPDLARAIAGLSRRQREVITLHYLADLSVDEVGTVLAIAPGSVKSHLFDARRALRIALETS